MYVDASHLHWMGRWMCVYLGLGDDINLTFIQQRFERNETCNALRLNVV